MNEQRAKQNRTIEELNQDRSLKDVKIIWAGKGAILTHGNENLALFSARSPMLQNNIIRWLNKNNMRCTQIHDGKIWL